MANWRFSIFNCLVFFSSCALAAEPVFTVRLGDAETLLAKSDTPPDLAPFDWQKNPMCPGWHNLPQVLAEERGLHQWRMDRMRLEAVGEVLRAWIDGKEVFPGGVKDVGAALVAAPAEGGHKGRPYKSGTAGLYAEGLAIMDNVEVRPAR